MTQGGTVAGKVLTLALFLICVNMLAGVIAIRFNYPSLFNVNVRFAEYAVPLPFTWAFAHWPSMLLFGVPLLYHARERERFVRGFRIVCLVAFGALLLEMDEKNPLLLFPKVDAALALVFSLALVPPRPKTEPALFATTLLALLVATSAVAYQAYAWWRHLTPEVQATVYAGGAYELTGIVVNKPYHEMRFEVELRQRLPRDNACTLAQDLGRALLHDYPFDNSYRKLIDLRFNPANGDVPENAGQSYPVGEISLNEADRERNGDFACYLSYKN